MSVVSEARIQSVSLKGFKRFKSLDLTNLTDEIRLVFLLGPNGCGKSSLFEAFNTCGLAANEVTGFDRNYYMRLEGDNIEKSMQAGNAQQQRQQWQEALAKIKVQFFHREHVTNWLSPPSWAKEVFSVRGSQRQAARHESAQIAQRQQLDAEKPISDALRREDSRITNNYQRLIHHQLTSMVNPGIGTSDERIAKESLKPFRALQKSTLAVFPGLNLHGLGNPTGQGTFEFSRGDGGRFRFDALSSGEKSAFDILLDLHLRSLEAEPRIYCIDEPEAHIHSATQAKLIEEVAGICPPSWQLWIATHSVGILRWATEYYKLHPGQVAFLDLGEINDEGAGVIKPSNPSPTFWKSQLRVATGDLADLVVPDEIVVCEGNKNKSIGFDAEVLSSIFCDAHPHTFFISAGSKTEAKSTGAALALLADKLVPGTRVKRLYDRDDFTPEERKEAISQGDAVLDRRELENYLFDDVILRQLVSDYGKLDAWQAMNDKIQQFRSEASNPPRSKPSDDVKSISNHIHQLMKRELAITQSGSNYEAFAKAFLVPRITPETEVYQQLQQVIWPTSDDRDSSTNQEGIWTTHHGPSA